MVGTIWFSGKVLFAICQKTFVGYWERKLCMVVLSASVMAFCASEALEGGIFFFVLTLSMTEAALATRLVSLST